MLYGLDQHDCLQMPHCDINIGFFRHSQDINECGWLYIIFYPAGLSFNGCSLLCVICSKYMYVSSYAFQVFVGVYTAKSPMDAPALMKYSEVVRDLAARGANWRFYDSQFRLLRQSNPTEFPWGSTHWELWIRAQHFNNACFSKAQMPARHNSSNAGSMIPKGFCRKFHRGTDCPGCSFKHQCFKCGVVHPALRCNFRPQQSTPKSVPTAAKSRPTNPSSN